MKYWQLEKDVEQMKELWSAEEQKLKGSKFRAEAEIEKLTLKADLVDSTAARLKSLNQELDLAVEGDASQLTSRLVDARIISLVQARAEERTSCAILSKENEGLKSELFSLRRELNDALKMAEIRPLGGAAIAQCEVTMPKVMDIFGSTARGGVGVRSDPDCVEGQTTHSHPKTITTSGEYELNWSSDERDKRSLTRDDLRGESTSDELIGNDVDRESTGHRSILEVSNVVATISGATGHQRKGGGDQVAPSEGIQLELHNVDQHQQQQQQEREREQRQEQEQEERQKGKQGRSQQQRQRSQQQQQQQEKRQPHHHLSGEDDNHQRIGAYQNSGSAFGPLSESPISYDTTYLSGQLPSTGSLVPASTSGTGLQRDEPDPMRKEVSDYHPRHIARDEALENNVVSADDRGNDSSRKHLAESRTHQPDVTSDNVDGGRALGKKIKHLEDTLHLMNEENSRKEQKFYDEISRLAAEVVQSTSIVESTKEEVEKWRARAMELEGIVMTREETWTPASVPETKGGPAEKVLRLQKEIEFAADEMRTPPLEELFPLMVPTTPQIATPVGAKGLLSIPVSRVSSSSPVPDLRAFRDVEPSTNYRDGRDRQRSRVRQRNKARSASPQSQTQSKLSEIQAHSYSRPEYHSNSSPNFSTLEQSDIRYTTSSTGNAGVKRSKPKPSSQARKDGRRSYFERALLYDPADKSPPGMPRRTRSNAQLKADLDRLENMILERFNSVVSTVSLSRASSREA